MIARLRYGAAALALGLALAGCGKRGEANATAEAGNAAAPANAAIAAPANAAAPLPGPAATAAARVEAGSWRETSTLVSIEFPGAPAGPEIDRARKTISERSNQTRISCRSEAEAADPFPKSAPKGCSFERYAVGGGKVDAAVRCPSSEGERRNAITGSYTATTTDLVDVIDGPMPRGGRVKATVRIQGERVGPC